MFHLPLSCFRVLRKDNKNKKKGKKGEGEKEEGGKAGRRKDRKKGDGSKMTCKILKCTIANANKEGTWVN